jgi:hypothetical protein
MISRLPFWNLNLRFAPLLRKIKSRHRDGYLVFSSFMTPNTFAANRDDAQPRRISTFPETRITEAQLSQKRLSNARRQAMVMVRAA